MNNIPFIQNEQAQLDRLAAQRQLYSEAKLILVAQIALAVGGVILGILSVNVYPNLKLFAAYYGLVVTAIDFFYLAPKQNDAKKCASKVQELFDCAVLGLEWPTIIAGHPPEKELVVEKSRKYSLGAGSHSALQDWYSRSVEALPLHLGRLVCQRSNFWWDATLRKRYTDWVTGILIVSFVLLAGGLVFSGFTPDKMLLAVLVPFSPAFYLGVRQIRENKEAVTRLERLREYSEKLWDKILKNDSKLSEQEITLESRRLQDELLNHRSKTPLIFNWIQNRLRSDMDVSMNVVAADLVADARQKLEL